MENNNETEIIKELIRYLGVIKNYGQLGGSNYAAEMIKNISVDNLTSSAAGTLESMKNGEKVSDEQYNQLINELKNNASIKTKQIINEVKTEDNNKQNINESTNVENNKLDDNIEAVNEYYLTKKNMQKDGMAVLMKVLAVVTYIGAFIAGIVFGRDLRGDFLFGYALMIWVAGFVGGSIYLAIAHIIDGINELKGYNLEHHMLYKH